MNPGDRQGPGGPPRSAFGSAPWTELPATPEVEEHRDRRTPFGGDGWTGTPGLAADSAEPERPEEKPAGKRRRSKGPTHTRRTLAALGSSVDLLRDPGGVAHVYAKSERDAYAALGFCMAEDRLWQMDFFRRRAGGRSAELLGASAARHDALVRTVGIPRRAAAAASRMDGIARDVLAAFAGGVNAARAVVKPPECERLGYEIEPWTIADSLAIELYLAWSCAAATWPEKLVVARALSAGGVDRARVIASRSVDFVANTDERIALWRRIDSRIVDLVTGPEIGMPMGHAAGVLAGDVGALSASFEFPAMSPSPMIPISLNGPDFKVVGIAHVGMPGLLAGRNEDIAWGVTAGRLDDADCVMEELDGIGGFRTEAGWEKLSRRREMVRVRDGETLRLEVTETRHGPLLSQLVDQLEGPIEGERPVALALCWGANSLGTALPGLLAIARSASASEACEAGPLLDRSPLALEAIVTDRSGQMGKVLGGGLPTRDAAARLPVRGWASEARWTGVEPLSGESGLLDARVAVAVGALGKGGNEALLVDRAARLGACVENAVGVSALDKAAADDVDGAALGAVAQVRTAFDRVGPDAVGVERVRRALSSWDGSTGEASVGAAVFHVALSPYLVDSLLPEARFGKVAQLREVALGAVLRLLRDGDPSEERVRSIVDSFQKAEQWLGQNLGADPSGWTWGRVLTRRAGHPCPDPDQMAPSPVAGSGSPCTVLGQRFSGSYPPFELDVSTAARLVADLGTADVRVAMAGADVIVTLGERPKGERVELISG